MKSNLFVVASPFQVLSAFEALYKIQEHNSHNIILIYNSGHELNGALIKKVVDTYESLVTCEIVYLKKAGEWSFLEKLSLIKKYKHIRFDNLCLGHLEEYSNRLFMCNIKCDDVYSLDDGAATLVLNDTFNTSISKVRCNDEKGLKGIIKKSSNSLFRLKGEAEVKINWFTMFPFKPKNGNKYLLHNFEGLKKIVHDNKVKEMSEKIYFIGSNLVNAGVVNDLNGYIEMLSNVFSIYRGKQIIYVPHRYEDTDPLSNLFEKYSVKILRTENIIELFFLDQNIIPMEIVSFYSTALFSLSKIYPSANVRFKILPSEQVQLKFRDRVKAVQEFYKKYFEII